MFKIIPVIDTFQGNQRDGFNDFGDYIFRDENINIDGSIHNEDCGKGFEISDVQENYIPYMDELKKRGYQLLYIPNFYLETGCRELEKIENFHTILNNNYGSEKFEDVQLLFDKKYFYNTNYHLSNDGVSLKTSIFENHLRFYLQGLQ